MNDTKFSKELEVSKKLAREVGKYILTQHEGDFSISEKIPHYDFVTEVDKTAEEMIRSALKKEFPSYPFVGEEDDKTEEEILEYLHTMKEDEVCWVVDPLDGTLNFMQGVPVYGVSIGLVKGGNPVMGVIYLPYTDEMFFAEKDKGAWSGTRRLQVSKVEDLREAYLFSSMPVSKMEYRELVLTHIEGLLPRVRNIRAFGSAITCIAYVAAGRAEAYWAIDLKPWDVAAGRILLEEAGGNLITPTGERYEFGDSLVLASNHNIDKAILPYIK